MEFSILGPLEVRAGDRAVVLGGTKPRALLAVLLLHANQAVSAERLALALWGEDAPGGAVKTVQVHLSRLRRALGDPDVVTTTGAGYRLRVQPGELDAQRFNQLVGEGRDALAVGDAEAAGAVLREALGLWRGPPLDELAGMPFAPAEIARLEEERLAALELRVQADLAAGRHAELVAELGRLTREHPLREGLHGQLMLALYRSGRQADALDAYRHAREELVEQLGVEPGEELAELQQAILAHDPSLASPRRERAVQGDGRLPWLPNRTIGRDREIATIAGRLRPGGVRLLTLTGPGGVGKTRLAIEVARAMEPAFADGACFLPLVAVRRVEDVPMATVRALGAVVLEGESAEQAVERFLAARQLLLVADNCEHLDGVSTFIAEMLESCPGVTVLATSREPLALRAEERHAVPPLSLPDAEAGTGAAVTLFAERARAHDPEFAVNGGSNAAVADICTRLDGLPLAIELAAARCSLLTPVEIAQRLDTALGALGTGASDAPARQQTLRATIDWSYDLLEDDEKACFARFAVFTGGATVDAVETITGAGLDTIDRIVAKSMLTRVRQPDGRTWLAMLELIREYARERFTADSDAEAVRERHFRHFLSLAERSGDERALWGVDRKEHLVRLDADIENLHAALAWAVASVDAGSALAMCAALGVYWQMRHRYADAVRWIDEALELPGAEAHPALRVRVLCIKWYAVFPLGRRAEQPELTEAEGLARAMGDPALLSMVLQTRAGEAVTHEQLELADRLADEALVCARSAGDEWRLAMAAYAKAIASRTPADLRGLVDGAVALLERVGNVYFVADLLASAAYAALCLGSDVDASELVARATPVTRDLDNPSLWMMVRGNAGMAALFTGDTDAARDAFREELELSRELAILPFAGEGLAGLAAVAVVRGELERAAWLCGAAATHRYGQPNDPVDDRLRAAFFDPARRRLGAEAWDAAVRRGAAMSFEEAIGAALAERSPDRPGVAAA
jgi:predicted ATPase/DNA-binding SARP family transcriptional activator